MPTQVSERAITARLWLVERASLDEQKLVLEQGRAIAEDVIRTELANARLLSPQAHRMIMHQGRFDCLGQRSSKRRRDRLGHIVPPRAYRRMGGEYWLTNQLIYYIVDNGRIIAAVPLTENQLNTIEEFGDHAGPEEAPVSIVELVQQHLEEPTSGIRPIPTLREPEPKPLTPRAALPVPRWMERTDASWTLLVLDEYENVDAATRRVSKWMRREFGPLRPEPMYAERTRGMVSDVKDTLRKTKHVRSSDIPKLRGLNWRSCGVPLTRSSLRWWSRMFRRIAPAHGKLVMLVTPETARKILAVIDDSPRSAWRTNPATVCHGRAFRIAWNEEHSRFVVAGEDF